MPLRDHREASAALILAGLAREDIVLDADIPHIIIRPHQWRRLKTKGSERTLPLVGASLWAAKKAVEASPHSPLTSSLATALRKAVKQTQPVLP